MEQKKSPGRELRLAYAKLIVDSVMKYAPNKTFLFFRRPPSLHVFSTYLRKVLSAKRDFSSSSSSYHFHLTLFFLRRNGKLSKRGHKGKER